MITQTIYDEMAEFMASMNPKKVIALKPSKSDQKRLDFLLDKQKKIALTDVKRNELERYLILNRIIGLAKARAFNMISA